MLIPPACLKDYLKVIRRLFNEVGLRKTSKVILRFVDALPRLVMACSSAKYKNPIVVQKVLGHSMYVNLNDEGTSRELYIYGIHEPVSSLLFFEEIKESDVVIDIGANVGYYVLIECSLIKDKGKVIAIEPDPRSRRLLQMNIERNGYSERVQVLPVAVGAERKKDKMLLGKSFNLSKLNYLPEEKINGGEKIVDKLPLDEIILNELRIDVIRMDIEGYEFEAINGMIGTLTKFRPRLLLLELHPIPSQQSMQSFFELMDNLGYELKWVMSRQLMKAILNLPRPLLTGTLDIVQGYTPSKRLKKPIEQKISLKIFAEKFCSSHEVYHVVLQQKQCLPLREITETKPSLQQIE